MRVVPVPVRSDNYAYILIDPPTKNAAIVDPFDVPKVVTKARELGVEITACLTTHHHHDHSGGNVTFHSAFPKVPIYGGSSQIPALTQQVKDGDTFSIGSSLSVKCLHTPCHTQDSICYYVTSSEGGGGSKVVFTGDTLFIAGCGRFFEGTASEMVQALTYLGTLPDETIAYVGHEYTKGNLRFAETLLGKDHAELNRLGTLLDEEGGVIGKTTIGDEKQWNVFMPSMLGSDAVKKATGNNEITSVMSTLREMKNEYRG